MVVGQKLIAKNKFILWVEYTGFGSQIQNNRKKNYCLGFLVAKTKIFLNINCFFFPAKYSYFKNIRICPVLYKIPNKVLVVPDPLRADSSAECVAPGHVHKANGSTQRILPMRSTRLHQRIVVHAEDSSQPARSPNWT